MEFKTVRIPLPDGSNIILGQTHFIKTAENLETEQGRGIMGVIDGSSPKGVEKDSDKAARKALLRNFGYKVK